MIARLYKHIFVQSLFFVFPKTKYIGTAPSLRVNLFFRNPFSGSTVPDINALMLVLTSILVLIQLQRSFLALLVQYCLGKLSKVQKRVIVEPFDLEEEEFLATSADLVTSSSTFHKISEFSCESKRAAISYETVKHTLGKWPLPGAMGIQPNGAIKKLLYY